MGFLGSLGSAVGGFLGITSNRDNGAATASTNAYGNTLSNSANQWNGIQGTLNNNSNNLANQDFQTGAQNAYQTQVANYGQQQGAASMLYNQATGNTPSVADLQMQAGLGLANNQVQSAALSQQGGVQSGLTQRNMLNAQAAQNASIVSSGQATRANEINQAQQNYSSLLGQMGQTAAGMTSTQNTLGQEQYTQAANNLNYQTASNNAQQALASQNAASLLNAQQQNISGQWQASKDQSGAIGNTVAAIATGGASLLAKPAAAAAPT